MKTTKILIGMFIVGLVLVCGCENQLTPPALPEEGAEETSAPAQETSEQGEIPSPPPLPGG